MSPFHAVMTLSSRNGRGRAARTAFSFASAARNRSLACSVVSPAARADSANGRTCRRMFLPVNSRCGSSSAGTLPSAFTPKCAPKNSASAPNTPASSACVHT